MSLTGVRAFRTLWLVSPTVAVIGFLLLFDLLGLGWQWRLLLTYLGTSLVSGLGVKVWSDTHPPNDQVPSTVWLFGFVWPILWGMALYSVLQRTS